MSGIEKMIPNPVYVIMDGDLVIDRPVKDVWPFVLNYTLWQDFSHAEHISGPQGGEGEVVLLKKEEKGLEAFPPYYGRTLKIIPEQQFVWKTYPRKINDDVMDFAGIVDFRLSEKDGKTVFSYYFYYEFMPLGLSDSEQQEFKVEYVENFKTVFSSIFPKLKKAVESS